MKVSRLDLASLDLQAFEKILAEVPFATGAQFLPNLIMASDGDPDVARQIVQKATQKVDNQTKSS